MPTTTSPTDLVMASNIACGEMVTGNTTNDTLIHYYSLNLSDSTRINVTTCVEGYGGTISDTTLHIFDALTGIEVGMDDDDGCGLKSEIVDTLEHGEYIIAVTGYSTSDYGQYYLSITCQTINSINNTIQNSTTPSPTLYPKRKCANETFCSYVDLQDINGTMRSKTITIGHQDDNSDTHFMIFFTSKDGDCISPHINLLFEENSFSGSYSLFGVYDENADFLQECVGGQNRNCGEWYQCLHDYPLNINKISFNRSYVIVVEQPSSFDGLCSDHPDSIHFKIDITCASIISATNNSTDSPTITGNVTLNNSISSIVIPVPAISVCLQGMNILGFHFHISILYA